MDTIDLAEAKAHLSAIVEQAAGGEPVRIMRRGRPVAQVIAIEPQRSEPGHDDQSPDVLR